MFAYLQMAVQCLSVVHCPGYGGLVTVIGDAQVVLEGSDLFFQGFDFCQAATLKNIFEYPGQTLP